MSLLRHQRSHDGGYYVVPPMTRHERTGMLASLFHEKAEEYLHLIASNLFSATSQWFIYKSFQTPDSIIDSTVVDCLTN